MSIIRTFLNEEIGVVLKRFVKRFAQTIIAHLNQFYFKCAEMQWRACRQKHQFKKHLLSDGMPNTQNLIMRSKHNCQYACVVLLNY